MRTISDLENHYGRAETGTGTELVNKNGYSEEEEKIMERSIQVSLTLRHDFNEK
jgi:hypothetical protein